jgi:formate dehydrogenase iron-sulfur subunit
MTMTRRAFIKVTGAGLAVVKNTKAQLCNPEDVSVIFLVADDPRMYHALAVAQGPQPTTRQRMLAGLAAPLRLLAQNVRG